MCYVEQIHLNPYTICVFLRALNNIPKRTVYEWGTGTRRANSTDIRIVQRARMGFFRGWKEITVGLGCTCDKLNIYHINFFYFIFSFSSFFFLPFSEEVIPRTKRGKQKTYYIYFIRLFFFPRSLSEIRFYGIIQLSSSFSFSAAFSCVSREKAVIDRT